MPFTVALCAIHCTSPAIMAQLPPRTECQVMLSLTDPHRAENEGVNFEQI